MTRDAVEGLHDSTGTISIFGSEYVIAVYENARANGANIMLDTECLGIEKGNGFQLVSSQQGENQGKVCHQLCWEICRQGR